MNKYPLVKTKTGMLQKFKKFFRKIFVKTKQNSEKKNIKNKEDFLLIYRKLVDEKSIDINNISTETLNSIRILLIEEINIIKNKRDLDLAEVELIKREIAQPHQVNIKKETELLEIEPLTL